MARVLTTSHDIFLNVKALVSSNQKLLVGAQLLNNVAYLSLLMCGSFQLQIVSLSTQIIFNLATSYFNFSKGNYIETALTLLMSAIRSKQVYGYCELWNRRQKIEQAIKNVFVGKMGKNWQFPSDHLPIGVDIDGEFKVISWNVMNNCYMPWVKQKDSQGLKGSMLTELDVIVNQEGLTKRD
ncbi:MAG: hypothetical protein P0S95_07550 [Rhabdochlamydiaceae bacterium]|nr:hypothetical protein [Candidatus Amphrikana amoebophyrae]